MATPVSSSSLSTNAIPNPLTLPTASLSPSPAITKTTTTSAPEKSGTALSAETERYTAVQQSLANAKSAVSAASTANSKIDDSLKQVREIATKLSDDNLATKDREKLQADYQKLRDGIINSQQQAAVKTTEQKPADPKASTPKTNLLTDDKNLSTATNTRGGQLEIQSAQSAKALGLPEKIGSSADARALLQADANQPGSLANAEKNTRDTSARLKKANADLDQKLEVSSAVAKAVKRLDVAKNGGIEVSAEREEQRSQALERARETSQLLKQQFGGLSQTANSAPGNPLLALLR